MGHSERALMPDYLRLFALFGIVVVNVQAMAYPLLAGFDGGDPLTAVDAVAVWLVEGLALLKSYGLFSFMFGVGLAFQIRSAERRGLAFGPLYRNRMLGLLLLGVAHGCLFFSFDVLAIYATMGGLLYAMRGLSVRALVLWGGALLTISTLMLAVVLVATAIPLGDDPELLDFAAWERSVATEGAFLDAIGLRSAVFAFAFPVGLATQGVAALGWFCLGLAAVRVGLIEASDHPLWRRARLLALGPGVIASLGGAALWRWGEDPTGLAIVALAAPIATLGYLGLIAAIARPVGGWRASLLRAGGASLTVYLGQSILLSTVFSAYGFGLWDAVAPATAVGIAVAATLVLIAGVALWLRIFEHGPFEAVLKRFQRLAARPAPPPKT